MLKETVTVGVKGKIKDKYDPVPIATPGTLTGSE
jgi:hypothetical protein